VKAEDIGVSLVASQSAELAQRGMAVMRAVEHATDVVHPQDPDLSGLYGVIILGEPKSEDSTSRNATVYHGGLIDRSPCATGMAATMACLAADERLAVGASFISESIVDTTMSGRIVVGTTVGQHPGIVVEISGRGALTAIHQFFVDPAEWRSSSFVQL
jgi:proline racemase